MHFSSTSMRLRVLLCVPPTPWVYLQGCTAGWGGCTQSQGEKERRGLRTFKLCLGPPLPVCPHQPRWACSRAWMCPGLPPDLQAGCHFLSGHLAILGTPETLQFCERAARKMHTPKGGAHTCLAPQLTSLSIHLGPGETRHFPRTHLLQSSYKCGGRSPGPPHSTAKHTRA